MNIAFDCLTQSDNETSTSIDENSSCVFSGAHHCSGGSFPILNYIILMFASEREDMFSAEKYLCCLLHFSIFETLYPKSFIHMTVGNDISRSTCVLTQTISAGVYTITLLNRTYDRKCCSI